jgi:hypothetical protein
MDYGLTNWTDIVGQETVPDLPSIISSCEILEAIWY